MNLIILTEADRTCEQIFELTDHRAIHIREVLRSSAGESVEVGLLNGPVGIASITEVTERGVALQVTQWREAPRLSYEVDLICAISRQKTMRKVLTVSAMMGVRSVHFVRANRPDKSYVASPVISEPGCLPYLMDGLGQGKFTRVPNISVHPLFRPFVEDQIPRLYPPGNHLTKLLADNSGEMDLGEALAIAEGREYLIAIGPEGGWVPFEIELLKSAGFRPLILGPWTLRVETAVTAALAQLELVAGKSRK
ncbi:MAG: 16S rRNA (uracil(1498)-N(3))-methyltransferase [Acidobacteriia bacterium]|nr:16S rRNA (uracil(1498)-N(3))-methyltransferase [Terriglobia bacterium]